MITENAAVEAYATVRDAYMPHRAIPSLTALRATDPAAGVRGGVEPEHVFFGYAIPHLSEALTSQHLAADSDQDRLREILDRHVGLVTSLGKWKNAAFALRYLSDPATRSVEVALIARVRAARDQAPQTAALVARDVGQLLAAHGLPTRPFARAAEVARWRAPFATPAIVEVRQHEDFHTTFWGDPLYVAYPFQRPVSTWIDTFELLLRASSPCLVSVHLQPTTLFALERSDIEQVAWRLASAAEGHTLSGYTFQQRVSDPISKLGAQLYANYAERLADPYLILIQVASPDAATALAVAQSLGAEVSLQERGAETGKGEAIPAGFDVIVPQGEHAERLYSLRAAHATLEYLVICPWGNRRVPTTGAPLSEAKERLRYLADARTASAAFRFPVALRGGIPGIRTRQHVPTYDLGAQEHADPATHIALGSIAGGRGGASIPLDYLTHHMLVAGIPGYGKTTTCMHLLTQLWERHVPFLVVEPVKQEYRSLLDAPGLGAELRVFTLGHETLSPFRFNPLQLIPNSTVEAHISTLRGAIEAAFPTIGPLPNILQEALVNVYLRRRWRLTDTFAEGDERAMPTLGDLYFELTAVTERRGYAGDVLDNIRGAVGGRIGSLLRGSLGRMLNTVPTIRVSDLLAHPTVIELGRIRDENERATVLLLLFNAIAEYCQANRLTDTLQHVLLVEEAHRVMRRDDGGAGNREVAADAVRQAAHAFGDMISEMRALGEGLVIADQTPSRLAEDTVKNTALKIVHRLTAEDDRRVVCATMNATPEQERYMVTLDKGEVVFLGQGYQRPTVVQVTYTRRGFEGRLTDDAVRERMRPFHEAHPDFIAPFYACAHCQVRCVYRDEVDGIAYDLGNAANARRAVAEAGDKLRKREVESAWADLRLFCDGSVSEAGMPPSADAAYCVLAHIAPQRFGAGSAERFRTAVANTSMGEVEW